MNEEYFGLRQKLCNSPDVEQRTHKTATVDKNTSGFPPNICSYKTDSLKKQKDVNSGESSAILFQIKTTNEAKQVESQRI